MDIFRHESIVVRLGAQEAMSALRADALGQKSGRASPASPQFIEAQCLDDLSQQVPSTFSASWEPDTIGFMSTVQPPHVNVQDIVPYGPVNVFFLSFSTSEFNNHL